MLNIDRLKVKYFEKNTIDPFHFIEQMFVLFYDKNVVIDKTKNTVQVNILLVQDYFYQLT